ncbi:MAG: right-handed parallel beta-helix repeat-containing protein, partial [Lentisphaerae bacterium]|nr:right-handed parallel beta-helix repeat-containing protein [Lentisphaerota bacterium]
AEAIYTDEGSAHIVIENNLCHDTNEHVFHQHFGHENILRNNIFAFGKVGGVSLARSDATSSFTFERNILVGDGRPLYVDGYGHTLDKPNPVIDLNVLWDVSGRPVVGRTADKRDLDLARWQAVGNDLHSVVADPLFRDLAKRDFTLAPDSPALRLGFKPIDVSDVGPRPSEKRT